ncbi:MAG: rhodanese [Candidatus Glassbacteria bacterium RBG_16_58_8]|uniref:Rhodanese n=1 Tax=Candidatus Glassbacteria bacterium RBG_16_58_8 TaxID=1817866 RepID=A0A1F5YBC0_9BACT|nr:MAG: rhodanese [Candidatus Glassbacteria bacterium RBG_16_58_8]
MALERTLRGIAGTFVIASLILSRIHSPWWLLFTLFVGVNLLQSAFSDWCPMMSFLKSCGLKGHEGESRTASKGGTR